jgi:hypothetical protein
MTQNKMYVVFAHGGYGYVSRVTQDGVSSFQDKSSVQPVTEEQADMIVSTLQGSHWNISAEKQEA